MKLIQHCFVFMIASIGVPVQAWEIGEPYTLSVAGSAPSHSIYAINVAHKQIIEAELPGVRLEILATQGGGENIELMIIGDAQMANGNTISAYSAHTGTFIFEGQQSDNIVSFFPGYTWEIGAMVAADSEFETFRDLVGHSIALGPVGSGAEATVTSVLEAIDLTDDDFRRVQRSSPSQAFSSLAAGQIDAVVWGTAHPSGLLLENQATQDLRFIPFTEDDLAVMSEALPFYSPGTLRPGTYKGQEDSVDWIEGSTHFWIDAKVPTDLVYAMTRSLWENRSQLAASHSSQALIDEALVRRQANLVPFHAGANLYFQEIGILPTE